MYFAQPSFWIFQGCGFIKWHTITIMIKTIPLLRGNRVANLPKGSSISISLELEISPISSSSISSMLTAAGGLFCSRWPLWFRIRPSLDFCNCSSRESDSVDSDKGSNEGMIFFRVELLRLRDLVRAVGLSLLRLEGLSEKKIAKIQIKIRIKNSTVQQV